jgi:ADP-heptose:LPS heptosyltransferase
MASTLTRIRDSALPRFIDRAAGTPLLWLWGALRRRRAVPGAPRRFGLMIFETIGDTLLAGTIPASLRAAFPHCDIVMFVSRGNRGVLPLFEGIARVVEVPLTQPVRAMAAIRSEPVDVMIDIGQWPRWYALLCAGSRSSFTIGFETPGQSRHYAYDAAVPHGRDVHEVVNFQRLLAPIPGARPLPPSEALRAVAPVLPRTNAARPCLVVHPWASGFRFTSREWPLERWVDFICLAAREGYAILVSGGPADRERAALLVDACPAGVPVISAAGELALPELAGVLRGAAAAVCVNTGVMHLAAVLDVPLVALHGPTSRLRWGPVGARSIALAPTGAGDCEFLHLGFEYPGGPVDCMRGISVDAVLDAVRQVTSRVDAPARPLAVG